jgi:hypothetical protein
MSRKNLLIAATLCALLIPSLAGAGVDLSSEVRVSVNLNGSGFFSGASLRRELGDELRETLQEQFALNFEASDQTRSTRSTPAPEPLSAEQREARELAFGDAVLVLDDAQLRGRFDPESRDALRELLPELGRDGHSEVLRRLSLALNEGTIEFEDPSELPF